MNSFQQAENRPLASHLRHQWLLEVSTTQDTRELARRIRSVQSTRKITRAMEMVAAAKLKKAQSRTEAARPYIHQVRGIIARLIKRSPALKHPLLKQRDPRQRAFLVITSDRGLSGGYNSSLLKRCMEAMGEPVTSSVIVLGRKGRDYFRRRNVEIKAEYLGVADYPSFAEAEDMGGQAVQLFLDDAYQELYLVYNEFVTAMHYKPVVARLLPLEPLTQVEVPPEKESYLFEPSPRRTLDQLLPRYINSLIYSAILEAKAAEHGARRTAMGAATSSAGDMIDKLTLRYNRARQAAITQEILEVVSGGEGLK